MSIPIVSSNPSAASFLNPETAVTTGGKQTLGVEDFLKLLTAQLTAQDPLKPMEDTQFLSQMASFTSLQQMRDLAKSFDAFSEDQRLSAAQNFLGRNVTVATAAGDKSGIVSAVKMNGAAPAITLGGEDYALEDIRAISAAPAIGDGPSIPSTTSTQP